MGKIAVAIGFGIVMGILFLVRGETGAGLGMLGVTFFIAAIIFSPSASGRLLITSIS